jgi:hypothetical protein
VTKPLFSFLLYCDRYVYRKSPLELSSTKNKVFKVAQFSLAGFYLVGGSWDIESRGDS